MTYPEELQFKMKNVTYKSVENELKSMRMDCSAGYDHFSMSYIKPVIDELVSPLTHIINESIEYNTFPQQWKIGKISPIPKTSNSTEPDEFRPISILPIFSKIFERLIAKQICDYIERTCIYKNTMSGFRRSHSTSTLLLKIRDDILEAMKKGELSLAIFSDYSKAFDTVSYSTILKKLNKVGFGKDSLLLMTNYLTNRQQFVQVDDKTSTYGSCNFGVPQGSVLGPILFNLYVSDLQDNDTGPVCQYADDTTQYNHFKLNKLNSSVKHLEDRLSLLNDWSVENNLLFNKSKTKSMLFASSRMYQLHDLNKPDLFKITINNGSIERVSNWKVLGVMFDENLTWDCQLNVLIKSCFGKLAVLRKLKRYTSFINRKRLAESLILSKLDYCNVLYTGLTQVSLKRMQRVLNSTAAFVTGHYCCQEDVIKLVWLPIKERITCNTLKFVHKSLYDENFPQYLKVEFKNDLRTLRGSEDIYKLEYYVDNGTFRGTASVLFNNLPYDIRSEKDYNIYSRKLKEYLLDCSLASYISSH